MNKPEKKSLIIGGSIIGGLVFAFVLYRKFKSNSDTTTDEKSKTTDEDSESDNQDYNEQIDSARGEVTYLPTTTLGKRSLFPSDDESVSDTSLTESRHGGKKKKSRRQKKKKSKNNRKRRSKKNKKSRK